MKLVGLAFSPKPAAIYSKVYQCECCRPKHAKLKRCDAMDKILVRDPVQPVSVLVLFCPRFRLDCQTKDSFIVNQCGGRLVLKGWGMGESLVPDVEDAELWDDSSAGLPVGSVSSGRHIIWSLKETDGLADSDPQFGKNVDACRSWIMTLEWLSLHRHQTLSRKVVVRLFGFLWLRAFPLSLWSSQYGKLS